MASKIKGIINLCEYMAKGLIGEPVCDKDLRPIGKIISVKKIDDVTVSYEAEITDESAKQIYLINNSNLCFISSVNEPSNKAGNLE